ncbi:DUF4280 domain-containing protein [Flavobacterium crocinum]|uniref:DUF4280 domain-containing protein n=1 Tax=Flavobacterium crocinum TaxID=2183896 RepID=A0A2S1YMA0_9FLAO|nr:PAAR-like protein [Flavobacterium crocinum]AWK05191.1 DUF4280 domain-containing protein [Flavobacterium crocinum]
MSDKYVVVHGATCKCRFSKDSKATDILQVKSQKKHFANDKGANKKLIATTKELGQTLQKGTFGNCLNQPLGNNQYQVCIPDFSNWSKPHDKVTLSNQGKILIEDSKATCKKGLPDCIEITKHGQIAEVGKQQMQKADRDVIKQINPLLSLEDLEDNQLLCS